jgi:SAM-dependent methyltransferase
MIPTRITIVPSSTNVNKAFPDWIAEYCNPTSLVLDIGAGYDRNQIDAFLKSRVSCLVGIDPSEDILSNLAVDERYQTSLENFAKVTEMEFDVLFSVMVLEHVTDPTTFFSACGRMLKPGGTLFMVTPNLWHYFGLATKITSLLGMNEWILDRLIGKQHKETYHFSTTYRINSLYAIRRILTQVGFSSVEFQCFDAPYRYNYVIPKYLRWFPHLYSRLVYWLNLPFMMGTIMFRATV